MKKEYFKIFSGCIIVKGHSRSLIADIQRENSRLIPDTMHDVIVFFQSKKKVSEAYDFFGSKNISIINEYLDFLVEKDFGFFCENDEFDLFPAMSNSFTTSSILTNAIIELSQFTIPRLEQLLTDLEELKCQHIQLVSFDQISKLGLIKILGKLQNTNLRSIDLILKYSRYYNNNFIKELDTYNFRITNLLLHTADSDEIFKYSEIAFFEIKFTQKKIKSFMHCGIVDLNYFDTNKNKVLESLNHNSCLNRKISIDKEGNIKNCPSMAQSFGNIKDTTLQEALDHPDFKKYWNITKDQIEVCKDCEFRHICTDCRAYIEDPENQYSKPLKCGYNPYTNVWEEWSTNPLKQKAIEYYGMQDLIKKDA